MNNSTRTFTEDEQSVLVMALIAYKRVDPTANDIINDIIRDGWTDTTATWTLGHDVEDAIAEVNNMAPAAAEQANDALGLDPFDRARLLGERIGTLCSTLTTKARDKGADTTFYLDPDRRASKYGRIIMGYSRDQRSVHAFVEMSTGDLIKAAGWKAPAKRKDGLATVGSLLNDDDFARILRDCDQYGGYLYADAKRG